jgi:hypothetical protein
MTFHRMDGDGAQFCGRVGSVARVVVNDVVNKARRMWTTNYDLLFPSLAVTQLFHLISMYVSDLLGGWQLEGLLNNRKVQLCRTP